MKIEMPKLGISTHGMSGFFVGLIVGFIVDKIGEYIYSNYVPEANRFWVGGMLPIDDVLVDILPPVILLLTKRYAMAGGWFLGGAISSGWFK